MQTGSPHSAVAAPGVLATSRTRLAGRGCADGPIPYRLFGIPLESGNCEAAGRPNFGLRGG
jgi:hypothetical protein